MATTTNALGARMLARWAANPPTCTRAQLDAAYNAGWISDADYQAAINPPPAPAATEEPAAVTEDAPPTE